MNNRALRAVAATDGRLTTAVLISAAVLLLLPTVSAAERPAVRVATYNVRNYLAMDRRVEGRFRPDYPKPEREKDVVRAVIRDVSPDILALQEIGPAPYLEELRRDLIDDGWEYAHSHLLEAGDPQRHVAILSRVPWVNVREHREITFDYFDAPAQVKRGLLEVTFADANGAWTLFVLHLKSRHSDRPDDPLSAERRVREARAIRDLILTRFPDPAVARFLLVGDCNDTTRSRTLTALRKRGPLVISEFVPAADSRGETWTHRYRAEDTYSRSDYLLVSPGFQSCVLTGQGFIHDRTETLEGSDHRMVYVDLMVER